MTMSEKDSNAHNFEILYGNKSANSLKSFLN